MRALVAEPPKRAALYGPVPNGALTALRARSRDVADGAVVVTPASYADISRAAHVFARAVAYNEVVRELHGAVPPPGNGGAMISLPLPAQGSRALTATRLRNAGHGAWRPLRVDARECRRPGVQWLITRAR